MPMVTKHVRVVIYCEEFLSINSHNLQWGGLARSHGKSNPWTPNYAKCWITVRGFFLKATLGQRNNLRNLDLHFHKTYGHWTWQVAYSEEQFQHANAWVATKLMFSFSFSTHCSHYLTRKINIKKVYSVNPENLAKLSYFFWSFVRFC